MSNNKISQVTPLVLAGGKSRRMGTNKSFVSLAGKPMLEIIIEKLKGIFSLPPILVTNSPELYSYLKLEMREDIIKDQGPLGGIHAGLSNSSSEYNFVFGCDMPFLNPGLISYMVEQIGEEDLIIPRHGTCLEPLHAIYSKGCLNSIEKALSLGALKIQSFFPAVKIRYIERNEIEEFEPQLKCFSNINTQQDLENAQCSWES